MTIPVSAMLDGMQGVLRDKAIEIEANLMEMVSGGQCSIHSNAAAELYLTMQEIIICPFILLIARGDRSSVNIMLFSAGRCTVRSQRNDFHKDYGVIATEITMEKDQARNCIYH